MNKHKVLFFSYWYPNKYNRIFPVFTRKHAQAIAATNDVVVLSLSICKSNNLFKREVEVIKDEKNTETHQVYLYSRFYKLLYVLLPLHYFILKKYLRKELAQQQFDILHSNVLFPCAVVGSWLSKSLKLKHVITEHWSRLPFFFKKNLYRFSAKKAYNHANAITCVSEQLAGVVRNYTQNKAVVVVPNVVDKDEFFYAPTPSNKFTFVAAANWTPPKNPFPFLDALKEIHEEKKLPDFDMCMVGNGAQLETIKQKNYPFNIRYTGILDTPKLREALNSANMFLHGSDYETFSTIIAEALMCGLPSVVSKVGIATEVINEQNGLLADNNKNDWKEKILICYNRQYDHKIIADQIKDRYNSATISEQFSSVYAAL